jgi:hypothetical protein
LVEVVEQTVAEPLEGAPGEREAAEMSLSGRSGSIAIADVVEARAQIVEQMMRANVEGRAASQRETLEIRVQASEQIAKAYAAMRVASEREAIEARVQAAILEAKSYATQGLQTQGASLRAMGKAVAELVKDNRRLSDTCATLSARLAACERILLDLNLRPPAAIGDEPGAPRGDDE